MIDVTRGEVDIQRFIAEQAVSERVAVEDGCYLVVLLVIFRVETDDLAHIGWSRPAVCETDVWFGFE